MNPFGKTRLLGFALLVVTFVAGAVAGAAVDRLFDDTQPADRSERSDDGERVRPHILDRIDLSDVQQATIDSILKRRAQRMRAVWREVEPRMDAIADSTRSEIMEILTDEQQAKYERLMQKRRDEWNDRDRRDRDGDDGDDRGDRNDHSDRDPPQNESGGDAGGGR